MSRQGYRRIRAGQGGGIRSPGSGCEVEEILSSGRPDLLDSVSSVDISAEPNREMRHLGAAIAPNTTHAS
jgi:hypothetical protein